MTSLRAFRRKPELSNDIKQNMPHILGTAGECCRRHLGLTPYTVQYLAALSLLHGEIAHMNTGEGKTLTAVMVACCKALEGQGVHVITVNEYLARRDYEDNLPVYQALGFRVGLSLSGMNTEEKQQAYQADITYTTATEAGFDYLRDSVAAKRSFQVQGPLHFAILDEVDSILLDEAITPMILSGGGEGKTDEYVIADTFARYLKPAFFPKLEEDLDIESCPADYVVDQRHNIAILTAKGIEKAESYYRIDNLFDVEHLLIHHRILQAITAYGTLQRDKDYIIRDGKICLVDRHTGRVMEGRRYSLGLHQAVEAREKLEIHQESRTIASITYQKFFSLYPELCGMTGTAWPARQEFSGTFGIKVRRIPPNRPCIRIDQHDRYFTSRQEKLEALAQAAAKAHAISRPVLIGTPSVLMSEEVCRVLDEKGIPFQLLNAKQDADEARLVAQAGMPNSVVVATNMAGRGTDIRLGNGETGAAEQVCALGGLLVLGAERQRSRRVDDQLIGRAGRQGDPGESIYFVCWEDEILRLFGPESKNEPLSHRVLARAQRLAGSLDASARKGELEADSVLQEHRINVQKERDHLMDAEHPLKLLPDMITSAAQLLKRKHPSPDHHHAEFRIAFSRIFSRDALPEDPLHADIQAYLRGAEHLLHQKDAALPGEFEEMVRTVLLQTVDEGWSHFLEDFLTLKSGYRLMSLGRPNPRHVLIKHSALALSRINEHILLEGLRRVFHCQLASPERKG